MNERPISIPFVPLLFFMAGSRKRMPTVQKNVHACQYALLVFGVLQTTFREDPVLYRSEVPDKHHFVEYF
jgi:membrane-bound metal-dependent hydrolase YbcI (DUF457 family)